MLGYGNDVKSEYRYLKRILHNARKQLAKADDKFFNSRNIPSLRDAVKRAEKTIAQFENEFPEVLV